MATDVTQSVCLMTSMTGEDWDKQAADSRSQTKTYHHGRFLPVDVIERKIFCALSSLGTWDLMQEVVAYFLLN